MKDRRRSLQILLVEDNPDDIDLTIAALHACHAKHRVHVVEDGAAALAYLRRTGIYEHRETPDLILLDLNLPKQGGHEVLEAVKSDPCMQAIPVIVLTSSKAQADIDRAYQLGANGYVTKPSDVDQLFEALRAINEFWSDVVTLPEPSRLASIG